MVFTDVPRDWSVIIIIIENAGAGLRNLDDLICIDARNNWWAMPQVRVAKDRELEMNASEIPGDTLSLRRAGVFCTANPDTSMPDCIKGLDLVQHRATP